MVAFSSQRAIFFLWRRSGVHGPASRAVLVWPEPRSPMASLPSSQRLLNTAGCVPSQRRGVRSAASSFFGSPAVAPCFAGRSADRRRADSDSSAALAALLDLTYSPSFSSVVSPRAMLRVAYQVRFSTTGTAFLLLLHTLCLKAAVIHRLVIRCSPCRLNPLAIQTPLLPPSAFCLLSRPLISYSLPLLTYVNI